GSFHRAFGTWVAFTIGRSARSEKATGLCADGVIGSTTFYIIRVCLFRRRWSQPSLSVPAIQSWEKTPPTSSPRRWSCFGSQQQSILSASERASGFRTSAESERTFREL